MRFSSSVSSDTSRPNRAATAESFWGNVKARVWPWVATGKIRPMVEKTFPLAQAGEAHRYMDESHVGKVVLTVGP